MIDESSLLSRGADEGIGRAEGAKVTALILGVEKRD
jgi:hypothetical protein